MAHSVRSRLKLKANDPSSSGLNCTPVKSFTELDKDYSPLFVPCTQESLDNVDVLWDWNSPQSKSRTSRKPKRIINIAKSSPKLPTKKTSHRTESFDKIQNELMAFQEEIDTHIPDSPTLEFDDSDLIYNNNIDTKTNFLLKNISQPTDTLFDDSLEDELLLVSQQVEENLKHTENMHNCRVDPPRTPHDRKHSARSPRTLTKSFSSNTFMESPIRIAPPRSALNFHNKLQEMKMNDSFDVALEAFDEELDIPKIKTSPGSPKPGPAGLDKMGDGLKFKAKSFSFNDSYNKKSNQEIMWEEIDKKRLAAVAKLKAKKSNLPTVLSDSDTSPIRCSPEEIELKRQQAMAKLQEKKKQELIERNRQEALKKLEMKRNKLRRPI